MRINEITTDEATSLALTALGWTLSNDARADRLLALTGLSAEDLRLRLSDVHLLAATLRFLEAHEPDLVACAEALGRVPSDLVAARMKLEP
jgi:hypothetical protein